MSSNELVQPICPQSISASSTSTSIAEEYDEEDKEEEGATEEEGDESAERLHMIEGDALLRRMLLRVEVAAIAVNAL